MKIVKQRVKQNSLVDFNRLAGSRRIEATNGAGDGIRTRDVLLGRQALCH